MTTKIYVTKIIGNAVRITYSKEFPFLIPISVSTDSTEGKSLVKVAYLMFKITATIFNTSTCELIIESLDYGDWREDEVTLLKKEGWEREK